MKIENLFYISVIFCVITGCGTQNNSIPTETLENTSTPTQMEIIATAPAKPGPSITPSSELPTETIAAIQTPSITASAPVSLQPVPATCIINSNVRSWPGKGGDNLGGLIYGNPTEVLARNPSGSWYLINYKSSPSGRGWIKSNAVMMRGYADLLPIALEDENQSLTFIAPIRWTIFGTPLPLPTPSAGSAQKVAIVAQTADVRVCPTMSCMIIAYLKPGDLIIPNGSVGASDWLRFIYPSGPNGIGWISTKYISPKSGTFPDLPPFDELGIPVTPEPSTSTPDPNILPTPTMTGTATPAGPLAEITASTSVFSQQSSFSQIIGTLQPGDKVNITSESLNHIWFEIQYPANTTGRAYISSKYVLELGDFRYLHYTDSNGTPVPTP